MNPAQKPALDLWKICLLCVGAFGIQFGFALPQANATRIFQNLGSSLDNVPLLCAREVPVPGSLPMVIRVLMHYNAPDTHRAQHVYLGEARGLRTDLSSAQ